MQRGLNRRWISVKSCGGFGCLGVLVRRLVITGTLFAVASFLHGSPPIKKEEECQALFLAKYLQRCTPRSVVIAADFQVIVFLRAGCVQLSDFHV